MRENSIAKVCFFEGHVYKIYTDVKERVLKWVLYQII